MNSITKAGIFGGIIIFLWGFISWGILPWHEMAIHSFTNNKAVTDVVVANAPKSGVYLFPALHKPDVKIDDATPMVFVSVNVKGMPSSLTLQIIVSIVSQIIAAFLVAWLLSKTSGLTYMQRVWFVLVVALVASFTTVLPNWNWFGFDTKFSLMVIADLLIGWFFASLVIAKYCHGRV